LDEKKNLIISKLKEAYMKDHIDIAELANVIRLDSD
jgi:hypothetical protein